MDRTKSVEHHRLGHRSTLFFIVIALALMLTVALTACGEDEAEAPDDGAAGAATGAAALVPEAIAEAGVLRVASDFPFAPMEFFDEDGTTRIGVDVELVEGIGDKLGLEIEWIQTKWDGLILGLQSRRYDMIAASMGDFTDRQEKVTFVDYAMIGEAVLVKKENSASVTAPEDLAGKTMGASRGTIAVPLANELSEQLEQQGLEPLDIKVYPGDGVGITAVQSGRAFGHILDLPAAAWEAQTAGDGELYDVVLANLLGGIPYGFAVHKDDMALAEAVKAALDEMIADGSYQAVFDKWGFEGAGLDEAVINGGTESSGA